MTRSRTLESTLANLLKYGTLLWSCVIGIGVILQAFGAATPDFDLVTIGIVGFIMLPILRLISMLVAYVRTRDQSMVNVVLLVLCLVIAGLIAGNLG